MTMKNIKLFPLLIVFYEIATYLSNDMYLPALPQLMHDFAATHKLAQLTLTSWFLGTASMQLILGPVSDQYGRRPVVLMGGVLFVIASMICATTHSMLGLLVARFFQGSAVCSLIVAGYAAIHEILEQEEAIKTLALMGSITILAPALGPLVGGLMLKFTGWRSIFWALSIWASIALLALYKWMPESNPPLQRKPFSLKLLAKSYINILINKNFFYNTLAFCFLFTGIIAWIAMGPFLVIDTFHYTPLTFGLFQAIVFGGFMLGSNLIKTGLDRFGISKLIFLGLSIALVSAGFCLFSAIYLSHHFIAFILSFTLFNFGSALAISPINRTAIESCQEPMGSRMAIFSNMMSWFGVIGTSAAGFFYNGTSISLGWIIIVSAVAACLARWVVTFSEPGKLKGESSLRPIL